jgi:hypothetical protein
MASNLPSSFSRGGSAAPQPDKAAFQPPKQQAFTPTGSSDTAPFMFLSIIALLISLASFYGAFYAEHPLSPAQKAALAGIADDLRSLQNQDVTLAAPVSGTLHLDQAYPASQMFPDTFTITADFNIPVDTEIVAVSATGQPVQFRMQENIPVNATIPISSAKAFGNQTIRISKDFPVDARFSSSIKVRAAYGSQLNSIIDRLDNLTGNTAPG